MLGRKIFFFDPDQMHKMSKAANASSCHTADASLLAAYSREFTKLLFSTFFTTVPLHYHVIIFSLLWDNNSSQYFPSDLQEAIVKRRDFPVFYFKIVENLNPKRSMNPSDDYFSGDEVAFFISKLFFCDRFTRKVFCFLSLKDVAQRLATYQMDRSPHHSIHHTHALWHFRKRKYKLYLQFQGQGKRLTPWMVIQQSTTFKALNLKYVQE